MHPIKALLVKGELQKILNAKFIKAIANTKWVSNLVIVPKHDGRIIICIYFKDINKAFTKDDFPLPNIDTLVENTTGHEMYSLMDDFSDYNQIMITEEDKHKMTFTTSWGTYCYRVILFGLKNVGTTYHRAMTYILYDYMHDILDDYVDDLIVKTKICKSHLEALCKILDQLLEYNVRLNPKKYIFGVLSRNIMSFIIFKWNIEVDPNKVHTKNLLIFKFIIIARV